MLIVKRNIQKVNIYIKKIHELVNKLILYNVNHVFKKRFVKIKKHIMKQIVKDMQNIMLIQKTKKDVIFVKKNVKSKNLNLKRLNL